jgi:phage host-nuclease inhibitor protein Gam
LVREIGRCQIALDAIAVVMNDALLAAQERAQRESAPILKQKNELENLLRAYCDLHRDEFKDQRSRETIFGRYGFRFSSFVAIRGLERAKQFLGKFMNGRFLRIREEVDRAGLQAFLTNPTVGEKETGRLEGAGIRISRRELWFCEPDLEKIRATTDLSRAEPRDEHR